MRNWKKQIGTAVAVGMSGMVFAQGSLTPPGKPGATMKSLEQLDDAMVGVSKQVEAVTTAVTDVSNSVAQVANDVGIANIRLDYLRGLELDYLIEGVSNAVEQVETRIDLATVAGNTTYHHVISQPGSYYLSRNLAVTKANGISITTNNVTLDLNGFTISRSSGSGGNGVYVSAAGNQTTIHNGSVSGFSFGTNAELGSYGGSLLHLKASQCSTYGIYAGSRGTRLVDCSAIQNTGIGIMAGIGSSLSGCIASANQGAYGIYAEEGSTLSGCVSSFNQGTYGIYADLGSALTDCNASHNTGTGSESYGIYALNSSVIGCTAFRNSNTNSLGTCWQGVGIYINEGLVKDCVASYNRGDGICVSSDSLVSGNQCDANGFSGDGAGIHVTYYDNRIENNTVTDNDRGIDVDNTGNFIARNTASGNTINWVVAADNACLVVSRTACTAISGNSGGTAPGSTDPNANFTY